MNNQTPTAVAVFLLVLVLAVFIPDTAREWGYLILGLIGGVALSEATYESKGTHGEEK